MNPLRIGTRGSPLALWQAHHVLSLLKSVEPQRAVELVEIQTEGDAVRDVPLSQMGGLGVFTKAIQQALLDQRVDLAVHSLKDLPTQAVPGLKFAATTRRANTADAFISVRHRRFDDLPHQAVVATSSLRRKAQLLHRRPDLRIVDIRGNVETRLRKLEEQNLDATILAVAGLERLGMGPRITEVLSDEWMFPAVGQGALGIECRAKDAETHSILQRLNDLDAYDAVLAERALLRNLQGGCQVPIGVVSALEGTQLSLRGVVLSPDGGERIEAYVEGPRADAEKLGSELAQILRDNGAEEILHPQTTSH